jgi:hypothetical protein
MGLLQCGDHADAAQRPWLVKPSVRAWYAQVFRTPVHAPTYEPDFAWLS